MNEKNKRNVIVKIFIGMLTGITGVAACIASLIFIFYLFFCITMPIKIKNIVGSPDGRYQAVLFERNPGMTSGFVYSVSIIRSGGTVSIFDMGNVYREESYDKYNEIGIAWTDDDHLLIIQGVGDAYQKEDEFHGIEVTYDKPTHR